MRCFPAVTLAVLGLLLAGTASPALAVDHNNIDANRPLSFDDAEAIAFREQALEMGLRLGWPRRRPLGLGLDAEYLYGFAMNTHLNIGFDPSIGGRAESRNTGFSFGDVSMGVLHNFNRQYGKTPALALRGDAFFPTGRGSQGVGFRLRGIVAATWADIQAQVTDLAQLVKEKRLEEVHPVAFEIRDLVRTLPDKSRALGPAALQKLGAQVRIVDRLAQQLDKYGDAKNQAATVRQQQALLKTLETIKALYPGGNLTVGVTGPTPSSVERELYLTPGGIYTEADIKANGKQLPSQKFRGVRPSHDFKPNPGDRICPVTLTKANPGYTGVIGGEGVPVLLHAVRGRVREESQDRTLGDQAAAGVHQEMGGSAAPLAGGVGPEHSTLSSDCLTSRKDNGKDDPCHT